MFYAFAILITRAEVGMYSVLVSGDSGALKREYTNQFRESLMIEALSKVQKMSPKAFQSKVSTEHMCILTMETFAKVYRHPLAWLLRGKWQITYMYLFIFSPEQTVIIPRPGWRGELGLEDLRGSHGFQGERRERSVVVIIDMR